MNSNFLRLGTKDFIRGLVVAVIAVVLSGILPMLESGALPTIANLKAMGIAGLAAGVAYLLKNLFTNSQGQMAKTETASPR